MLDGVRGSFPCESVGVLCHEAWNLKEGFLTKKAKKAKKAKEKKEKRDKKKTGNLKELNAMASALLLNDDDGLNKVAEVLCTVRVVLEGDDNAVELNRGDILAVIPSKEPTEGEEDLPVQFGNQRGVLPAECCRLFSGWEGQEKLIASTTRMKNKVAGLSS